ncbi:MAG: ABC transporter permease [Candidatus Omnitrophota bacterium]
MSRWADLIYELAKKNLRTRYSSLPSAIFWMFLFPFLTVGIFYAVFSVVLKVRIDETPFVLYLMTSVFTWQFFHDSVMASVTSLVDNKNLLRESNFPHYLVPISIIFTNMIIFLPSLAVTIFVSAFMLKGLPAAVIFLPFVFAIHLGMVTGLSVIFSILYVKWRDIKHILEACLTILFYLTPTFYSVYLIKKSFSPVLYDFYINNPFVGMLSLYRSVLLKGFYHAIKDEAGFSALLLAPFIFSAAVFFAGIYYYGKNRKVINDYLSY